jgi:small subunit ribosomal protein S2
MAVVTMRQMLESGVHFGHQTRRWNPKMKRFILTERNGIYIIDLTQSLTAIDRAYSYVKDTVSRGGTVMFVGTKKQAQEAVAEQATRVGMPYVNERWLGGMLTNFQTVHKRLQRLKELEQIDFDDVAGSGMTKKELLVLRREKDKLERTLGGIRDMARTPSAVWVVDTNKEAIAVGEARKLGIPVIAILDSNCDPDVVDFPIPGNDDAIRAVALLTRVIADAVAEGLVARASGGTVAAEPLAEWEAELLAAHQAEQAAEVVAVEAVAEAVVADVVAEQAVVEAVAAEAVAEEAVVEAVIAEAVADTELAEAAAGHVSAEEAQAAVDVATADELVAEEAVAEALVADAVAREAVAEAVIAEAVAEEAVTEAVVAEDVAAAVEAEAGERPAE